MLIGKKLYLCKKTKIMKEKDQNRIDIELSEKIAQGIYSNLAVISHSESDFVIDFIRLVPGVNKAKVKARIILTPQHAKRLLLALEENIRKFEQAFGPIEIPKTKPSTNFPPINFGGKPPQA